MINFSKNIISDSTLVKEAIQILNNLRGRDNHTLFVVNTSNQLIGTLSDGDVRRAMLIDKTINSNVTEIMQKNFKFLKHKNFNLNDLHTLRKQEITLVPLINENNEFIKIIDLNNDRSILPIDAVIMAGGEGRRLKPLTDTIPKPMLLVGDKPIIEHNIDRLEKFGINNINISVNYLAESIKSYFNNGSSKGLNINYCQEEKPLGTIGSIQLVKEFQNDVILVMNSDLLTNINYEDFYRDFLDKDSVMSVATIPYNVSVPYAVIETHEDRVISLQEKPTYTYYSNAGIYLIKKEMLELIPENSFFNTTDLMEKIIQENKKLTYYPLYCYWLDIGNPNDFNKAQEDFKHIKF
jgi:dTDP-glucose pyrophosphorylase